MQYRGVMEHKHRRWRVPTLSWHPPKPPAPAPKDRRKGKVQSPLGKDFVFPRSNYLSLPVHPNANPKSNLQPHGALYVLPRFLSVSCSVAIPESHKFSLLWQASFGRGGAGNAIRASSKTSPTSPTTTKRHKSSST